MDRRETVQRVVGLVDRAALAAVMGSVLNAIESGTYVDSAAFADVLVAVVHQRDPLLVAQRETEGEARVAVERQMLPLKIAERLLFLSRAITGEEADAIEEACRGGARRVA